MTVGPIPWTAIVEYADRQELDPMMHATFTAVMLELDAGYLGMLAKERKTKTPPSEPKKRHGMGGK